MIVQIFKDAGERPDLFQWTGPIEPRALRDWVDRHNILLHRDIFDLLARTGGGDLFETETILSPFGGEVGGDNAVQANLFHRGQGLPSDHWLFHVGLAFSAVRQSDCVLAALSRGYSVAETFHDFDQWYVEVLRNEYEKRYGLSPLAKQK